MKKILIYPIIFLTILSSCGKEEYEDNSRIRDERAPRIIEKVLFVVDKTSDEYKLFVDENGNLKDSVYIDLGDYKAPIKEVIGKESTAEKYYGEYLSNLVKIEGKNHSYIGLTTEGRSTGDAPGWPVLHHILHKVGKPFTIVIDGSKKFDILITNKVISARDKMVVNNNVMVNGKKTKFLSSYCPILFLN